MCKFGFNLLQLYFSLPCVLRLIMNMYTDQETQVKWNTLLSSKCKTSNEVKQGGCLSLSLFSVYLNNLIVKFEIVILDAGINLNTWVCLVIQMI